MYIYIYIYIYTHISHAYDMYMYETDVKRRFANCITPRAARQLQRASCVDWA